MNSFNSELTPNGKLFALLTACFYTFFTLVPDSHSLMVGWPWVFIWQVGLLCPVFWLLWLFQQKGSILGNYLDWFIGVVVIGIIVSSIFAQFPHQARWYGWAALCFIAALYALNSYLNSPHRRDQLLIAQGYLNLAFIVISLYLWTTQTFLPELSRIGELKQYDIDSSFNFSVLELRNWAPIGHQNYVAGYLLLALPLLGGLSILQKGWRRWLWIAGIGLGLTDLYTTSSRGGWLGLTVLCVIGLVFLGFRSKIPRLQILIGGISLLAAIFSLIITNNRLRNLIWGLLTGKAEGEIAYRIINATIGWRMGSDRPLTGIGLGGVPILYQKYRPIWAGRESELAYQLHTTPFHLWAEMGIWALIAGIGAIACLIYFGRKLLGNSNNIAGSDRVFCFCIYGAFLAYGVISLVDYQLDNVCISGTIVIYLACMASTFRQQNYSFPLRENKFDSCLIEEADGEKLCRSLSISLAGVGIVLAVILWLIPIHRAWQLSSQGFTALAREEIDLFRDRLTDAQRLAPWESYYPYQLGWNLGNLALQTADPQQQQKLLKAAIAQLERGNKISPAQEFGYSNLGWLLLPSDPQGATKPFARSAQLVPAKRGIFYGIGVSLLVQGKTDLAIEAMTLEGLRDPLFITSPIWRSPLFAPIYPGVMERMNAELTQLIEEDRNSYWYRSRAGLNWWRGNLEAARADLVSYGTPLSRLLIDLAEGKSVETQLDKIPSAPKLVIKAWFEPARRAEFLQLAWLKATNTRIPENLLQDLLTGMEKSSSFQTWLQENAPVSRYRRERSGFNVVSRHIDGVAPKDFLIVVENVAIANWFSDLFPSFVYAPDIDLILQPQREALISKIKEEFD